MLVLLFGDRRTDPFAFTKDRHVCVSGSVGQKKSGSRGVCLYLYDVSRVWQQEEDVSGQSVWHEMQSTKKVRGVLCYMNADALDEKVALPPIGSKVVVEGIGEPFEKASNEGQFDRQSYEQIRNLDFSIQNSKIMKQSNTYSRLRESLWRLNQLWRQHYERILSSEEAAFLTAVVLGDSSGMETELKELFRQNGAGHILAVSGMHISLLGMGIYRLLRKIGLPVWFAVAQSLTVILLYGMMIGAGIATIRAVIMFAMSVTAKLAGRTYDMPTALTIAACVLVTGNPAVLLDAGFQLSFGAIIAVFLIYPALRSCEVRDAKSKKCTIRGYVRDSLFVSVSIQLFLLPMQLYYYYEIPVYGSLLNLLILPVFTILLYCGFAGGILSMCSIRPGSIVLLPCRWIISFYLWLLPLAGKLPYSRIICGRPRVWQMIVYYGILLGTVIGFAHWEKRTKRIYLCLLMQAAICLLCIHPRHHTRITFLDVGQGDCCVIEQKDGCTFLVDAGSTDVRDCGRYRLIPFLKANGIRRIEYAFLSHPDEDHMNAMIDCLEGQGESGVYIRNLVMSAYAEQGGKYERVKEAAKGAGCRLLTFMPGDELRGGAGTKEPFVIRCLFPYGTEQFADANDQSLILQAQFGELVLLLTGDMSEAEEQAALLDRSEHPEIWQKLAVVDILKVAHHGSRFSSSQTWLEQIHPAISIISCGQHNSYGHPHAELLKRLSGSGSVVYRTDECGAVSVKVLGRLFRIDAFRKRGSGFFQIQ